MPVSGDFAALKDLQRKIEAVAGKSGDAEKFRVGLLTNCAEAAKSALDDSFITSADPYGNPWAPLRERAGKPLRDTGRLESSFHTGITGTGFYVETNTFYARTHQYGAGVSGSPIGPIRPVVAKRLAWKVRGGGWRTAMEVRIPRRQMVPEASTGGMGKWGDAVNVEAEEFIRAWFA